MLITSAADAAAFSKIAGREPGTKSWHRFGRSRLAGCTLKLMRFPESENITSNFVNLLNYCKDWRKLCTAVLLNCGLV
jgi:hypothetical protein